MVGRWGVCGGSGWREWLEPGCREGTMQCVGCLHNGWGLVALGVWVRKALGQSGVVAEMVEAGKKLFEVEYGSQIGVVMSWLGSVGWRFPKMHLQ